jgi:hypothetical protein
MCWGWKIVFMGGFQFVVMTAVGEVMAMGNTVSFERGTFRFTSQALSA